MVFNIWSYLQDKYPSTVTLMRVLSNSPTVNLKHRAQGILMSEHTECGRALTRCCPPLTVSGNGTPWQTVQWLRFIFSSGGKNGGGISRVTCSAFTGVAGQRSAGLSNDWTATNSDGSNVWRVLTKATPPDTGRGGVKQVSLWPTGRRKWCVASRSRGRTERVKFPVISAI